MEYSVRALSRLTGVTPRTLRWYHRLGLLIPCRVESSGYRYYGTAEVDRLQQILFYRALGVELERIRTILDDPAFDRLQALQGHLSALEAERDRVSRLVKSVQTTILSIERNERMSDQEKFSAFLQQQVEENEAKYGPEIRAKYGDAEVEESNHKLLSLTPEAYARMEELGAEIQTALKAAVTGGDNAQGEAGQTIARLHRQWLEVTVPRYSPQMHRGLGDMYLADERFTAYYDKETPGCAQFLRDAIHHWVSE